MGGQVRRSLCTIGFERQLGLRINLALDSHILDSGQVLLRNQRQLAYRHRQYRSCRRSDNGEHMFRHGRKPPVMLPTLFVHARDVGVASHSGPTIDLVRGGCLTGLSVAFFESKVLEVSVGNGRHAATDPDKRHLHGE